MSMKKLLDHYGSTQEIFHADPHDESVWHVEHREDVEPLIQAAKAQSEAKPGKDLRHAAYIPTHVLNRAFTEGWFHDKKAWKQWANDPANKQFRTWPGRL